MERKMSSIGLPSNPEFRNVYEKVSKDGKIDKNEYNALLKVAAPTLANSSEAPTLDAAIKTGELDDSEKAFFEGLKSVSDTKSVSVKAGSAAGTIDLFDDSEATNTDTSKYVKHVSLGGSEDNKIKVEDNKSNTPVVTGKEEPKVKSELDKLKELKTELNVAIEKTTEPAKKDELKQQLAVVDKKIAELEKGGKVENTPVVAGKEEPKVKSELDKLKELKTELNVAIEKTTEPAKKDELKQQLAVVDKKIAELEKAQLPTEKQKAFDEINSTIEKFTKLALETGDMSKFTEGKNEVQKIVEKYPNLKDDPEIKKIKEILSGNFSDSSIPAGNKVMKAVDTINGGNEFLAKEKPSRKDVDKAKEYVRELPEGNFKKKIEEKIELYNKGKLGDKDARDKDNIAGVKDVLGTGFFNSKNTDGVVSMFQTAAKKDELDALLKKLSADEQVNAAKTLANKGGEVNLSIAKKIYDNLSKAANVDEEFNKGTLEKIKQAKQYEGKDSKVDEKSFAEGLKYSMYSEKEAAMSMVRNMLDGDVSPSVLSKFDESEVRILSDLVKKKGTPEEKEDFLNLIASSNSSVRTENLSKEDKSSILKSKITSGTVNDSNIKETLNSSGKEVVLDLVKKGNLSDKEIALIAKNYDGDKLADSPDVAEKALTASIKTFLSDPKGSISKDDINTLIDQISKDRDAERIMKKVLSLLGDGPGSDYAKFKEISPATLDKMWSYSR
jgi:hypothetical protein